jgi:hypothetical protein
MDFLMLRAVPHVYSIPWGTSVAVPLLISISTAWGIDPMPPIS